MRNEKLLARHHQQNKIIKPKEDLCHIYNGKETGIKYTLHNPIISKETKPIEKNGQRMKRENSWRKTPQYTNEKILNLSGNQLGSCNLKPKQLSDWQKKKF